MRLSNVSLALLPAALLCSAVEAQSIQQVLDGTTLCGLGDLDGDGFGDLAVSNDSEASPSGIGVIRLRSGATGALLAVVSPTGSPATFGERLANAGDLNGDGLDDLLVSDLRGTGPRFVWAIDSATGSTIYTLPGNSPTTNQFFGTAISTAGDIDQDGVPDIAVGVPNQMLVPPAVRFYSGAQGNLIRVVEGLVDMFGGGTDEFGASIAAVGDVNLNGVPDVAVGRPARFAQSSCGLVVVSGADGSTLLTWPQSGICLFTGFHLGPLGDVNGDDVPDIWILDVDQSSAGTNNLVRAISGLTGDVLYSFEYSPDSMAATGLTLGLFATEAAALGDVDGDGLPDVAIGWISGNGSSTDQARITVYRGSDGTRLFDVTGPAGSPTVFGPVDVGDVSGDGFAELGVEYAPDVSNAGPAGSTGVAVVERIPANGRSICLGLPNSTGAGSLLRALSPSDYEAAQNDLTLAATRLPASAFGLFSVSQGDTIVFFPGGSKGRLCIGSPVLGRLPVVSANAAGQLTFSPDLTSIPQSSASGATTVAVGAGDTFNFQLWYRDSGPTGATSNFSGAVGITFQ